MPKSKKPEFNRRNFLKGAAAGAAALAANPANLAAAQPVEARRGTPPPPMSAVAESAVPAKVEVQTVDRPGSDFMMDVIKSMGFEYAVANPGSSFKGLHESLINYGGNEKPEFITCCHEESSVAMAHGYAKIEGKPLLVFAHGTVGLQHAAMGIYNAYCDRAPVYIILGNSLDATKRAPGVIWLHSVQDAAAMVRDYTKWDDTPISLEHFAESAVRAYKIAMTPPTLPVVLVVDDSMQEDQVPSDEALHVPKLSPTVPPAGESGAVNDLAKWLVAAETPVIVADRAARTPGGLACLIELAELLQSPVVDVGGRMNFPTRHLLNLSDRSRALVMAADVVLGLEMTDFWGTINTYHRQVGEPTTKSITKRGAKLITINSNDLYLKANYQDMERYPEVDLAIAADAEATLPSVIEAVKRSLTDDRKRALQDRGVKLAAAHMQDLERSRDAAAFGWDASPVSTARLSAELWAQIKDEDWSLVSGTLFQSRWPQRLWDINKHYQYIGWGGGYGVGYGAPAAVGAALANRKYGRLSVNIQSDGDLMYAPGVLWTAVHHHIPLLSIMQNNHAYHQELMGIQETCDQRNRGITRAHIGTTLTSPDIEYAKLAQSMGMYGEGPITDPKDLAPALKRAIAVVKRGEPALIDLVVQGR